MSGCPTATASQRAGGFKCFLPETRILFLASYADNRFVLAAMEAGADGYVLKESSGQRIVDAIHSILKGGTVFDPVVMCGVMSNLRSGGGVNPLASLTGQEGRVLAEVAKGKTDKEVAVALNLTTKTARNYRDHIFTKLNAHTRTEATLLYTRFSEKMPSWEYYQPWVKIVARCARPAPRASFPCFGRWRSSSTKSSGANVAVRNPCRILSARAAVSRAE